MDEIIDRMYKIENTIYNLYEKLINPNNSSDYIKNKELLKDAIKVEKRIFNELNDKFLIKRLINFFNCKLDDTFLDDCYTFEIPLVLKKEDLIDIRILNELDMKNDEIGLDILTLNEYKKLDNYIYIPGIGTINLTDYGIDQEFIDKNDFGQIKIFNKTYNINFKALGLKEDENDYKVLKEGIMLDGNLLYFPDDIKPDIIMKYYNKGRSEIILKFLNKLKKINYKYVYKLMFNNDYLENIMLENDFNIQKSLDIIKITTKENDYFYNYILKIYTEMGKNIIEILCMVEKPKYDIYTSYLKTILEYKSEEEIEEIYNYFNNEVEILNDKGYKYVKQIFDELKKQKRKQLH